MPRKPRIVSSTEVYHFINRGINKKHLFHHDRDFKYYLSLLKEYSDSLKIKIFHYCLMTNHTHLLLQVDQMEKLSLFGHYIQRRYAHYYSKTHSWPGQVFRRPFLCKPVENDIYLLECGRYIERNPVRANIVQNPEDYPYSSYKFYAISQINPLIAPSPAYLDLAKHKNERAAVYRFYVLQPRDSEIEETSTFAFKI